MQSFNVCVGTVLAAVWFGDEIHSSKIVRQLRVGSTVVHSKIIEDPMTQTN